MGTCPVCPLVKTALPALIYRAPNYPIIARDRWGREERRNCAHERLIHGVESRSAALLRNVDKRCYGNADAGQVMNWRRAAASAHDSDCGGT